jgi:hypothetical protein
VSYLFTFALLYRLFFAVFGFSVFLLLLAAVVLDGLVLLVLLDFVWVVYLAELVGYFAY